VGRSSVPKKYRSAAFKLRCTIVALGRLPRNSIGMDHATLLISTM
jgi:hypothetical protein